VFVVRHMCLSFIGCVCRSLGAFTVLCVRLSHVGCAFWVRLSFVIHLFESVFCLS